MNILTRGSVAQRLRLASGLVMFAFVLSHFLNHAVGLVSVPAMIAVQEVRTAVTQSVVVTSLLVLALSIHVFLAIARIVQRKTWRMPLWEAVQIVSGLAIPYLLASHVVFAGYAPRAHGTDGTYWFELAALWPGLAWQQIILLLLVWIHGCIGLHFWLRLAPWYQSVSHVLAMGAVLVPAAAIAGFAVAGRAVRSALSDPEALAAIKADAIWPEGALRADLIALAEQVQMIVLLSLGALSAYFLLRAIVSLTQAKVSISYREGPDVDAPLGPTLLEISRMFGVPHRSVCGGRGRCSTCRVRITTGGEDLPSVGPTEASTLLAIDAPSDVRLACQLRPGSPMEVLRLLAASGARGGPSGPGGALGRLDDGGREQRVTVLFLDLRGFTEFSEEQLPYDVIFLLNRVFGTFGEVIRANGGWIDKFMGDGLLAVFGTETSPMEGARAALSACAAVDGSLDALNEEIVSEGGDAIRIGMGLHAGLVVLGRVGDTDSAQTTVIGRTVNIASRLEGLSKEYNREMLVSIDVLEDAGLDEGLHDIQTINVRGISEPISVVGFDRAKQVTDLLTERGFEAQAR